MDVCVIRGCMWLTYGDPGIDRGVYRPYGNSDFKVLGELGTLWGSRSKNNSQS